MGISDNIKKYKTIEEFRAFEEAFPENGTFFNEVSEAEREKIGPLKKGQLYDVRPSDFLALEWLWVLFGEYENQECVLKISKATGEFFLASCNDGGHAPRFRIMKIDRTDIYEFNKVLIEMTENRSYQMWCGTASKADRF